MFLDLKDSTTIAEKIGHIRFVEFINRTYKIMSHSIIKNKAEILKYVGDEVILTWSEKNGTKHNNPINFYFDFKQDLENFYDDFFKEYGIKPVFKAGVNIGIVTAAFIGHIKKQMDYSGDTMNTTARIQALCNTYNADILMSENLANKLNLDSSKYTIEKLGEPELKGKLNKVALVKLSLKNN
jgi:adenylate cyclase